MAMRNWILSSILQFLGTVFLCAAFMEMYKPNFHPATIYSTIVVTSSIYTFISYQNDKSGKLLFISQRSIESQKENQAQLIDFLEEGILIVSEPDQ